MMNTSTNDAPPLTVISKPAITRRGLLIASGIWALYALFETIIVNLFEPSAPFGGLFIGMLLGVTLQGLLSIIPWWMIIRELDQAKWWQKLLAHAVAAPLYAFGWFIIYFHSFGLLFGPVILQEAQLEQNRIWITWGAFWVYLLQFSIYHIIRSQQRLREREKQAALLQELAREREIAALKAQINPHFLFNTLNTISAMISQDAEGAREMIARLAELLRYVLDSFSRQEVLLQDEIHFVRTYLELESKRFSDRLRYRFEIEVDAREITVPPMILQPLIENAVIHGIAPQEDGGEILLRITQDGSSLHFFVENSGARLSQASLASISESGIGLSNTNTRLRELYGPAAGLVFTAINSDRGGLRVEFTIPLASAAAIS